MKLVFQSGPRTGQAVEISAGQTLTIGREGDSDLVIDDPRVSRPHARIRVDGNGEASIEDLHSTNGTLVNGRRITGSSPLREGDTLGIGNTRFSIGQPAVRAGQPTVVAGQDGGAGGGRPPAGLTGIRQGVASANRRAGIAVAVAVIVIVVAIAGAGYFLFVGKTLSDTEIIAKLKPSVVFVLAQGSSSTSSGTGWILDADKGLIVTNNHVIQVGRSFRINAEGITPRTATVVASSPCDDVAVLHVDDKASLTSVKVGAQANLHQGDTVIALGFPVNASSDFPLIPTAGTISLVKTTVENDHASDVQSFPNMILSTAKINHGNSGGPLVDQTASVVGMNTLGYAERDQNYAIGIDRIKEITGQLSDGRGIGWTGMGFQTPTAAQLTALGFPAGAKGLLIVSALPGSEADIQGFGQFPLLLTAIDGHAIADTVDYCTAARGKQSGDTGDLNLIGIKAGTTQALEIKYTIHFR